jgi:hypothetical protein
MRVRGKLVEPVRVETLLNSILRVAPELSSRLLIDDLNESTGDEASAVSSCTHRRATSPMCDRMFARTRSSCRRIRMTVTRGTDREHNLQSDMAELPMRRVADAQIQLHANGAEWKRRQIGRS